MVDQAGDGPHAEAPDFGQSLVAPAPVALVRPVGGRALPQHRVAQSLEADLGETGEVLDPVLVAAADGLVEEAVADAVDRALVAAPQFKRRGQRSPRSGGAGGRLHGVWFPAARPFANAAEVGKVSAKLAWAFPAPSPALDDAAARA